MRSVDEKVFLLTSITKKQSKNRLIFSVAPLGTQHGLHLVWHGYLERVEVLRSDAHTNLLHNFFQPINIQLAPNLTETVPLPLKAKISPLLFKQNLLFVGVV